MILRGNENSASEALSKLLSDSIDARRAFLKIALPKLRIPEKQLSRVEVKHRHRIRHGEIDILLHEGALGVIVECKVASHKNAYQPERYRRDWKEKFGTEPYFVWLVQKHDEVLGADSDGSYTITWNDLHGRFLAIAGNLQVAQARCILTFCTELVEANIVLPNNQLLRRTKSCKGYVQQHAKLILTSIRDRVGGLDGKVEEVNECPPCLKAGRLSWSSKFNWINRVWLYMKPLADIRNTKCPFGFGVDVPLFHHHTADSFEDICSRIPQWARVCDEHGLVFRRNRPSKWKGALSLPYPFTVETKVGLNWLTASRPPGLETDINFDWRNDEAAIAAGVRHIKPFLQMVEKFR